MPKKELDLFELASRLMAQRGAGSTEIVRSHGTESAIGCRFADDGPDDLGGEAAAPDLAGLPDWTKEDPAL